MVEFGVCAELSLKTKIRVRPSHFGWALLTTATHLCSIWTKIKNGIRLVFALYEKCIPKERTNVHKRPQARMMGEVVFVLILEVSNEELMKQTGNAHSVVLAYLRKGWYTGGLLKRRRLGVIPHSVIIVGTR